MNTIFIADLHLNEQEPAITAGFLRFLQQEIQQTEALYILGDLFEVWIGDDEENPLHQQVSKALQTFHQRGIPCYFIHGNRDFLLGSRFAEQTGLTLLPTEYLIDLYGTKTLILHGDTLCTDDKAYQRFRRIVSCKRLQKIFLSLPLSSRLKIADKLRQRSQQSNRYKALSIMDVNPQTVLERLSYYEATQMIHGHTHKPAIHTLHLSDQKEAKRMVLGAWHRVGSVLKFSPQTVQLSEIPL